MVVQKVKAFLTKLTGSREATSLESRIFHTVCLSTIIALLIAAALTQVFKIPDIPAISIIGSGLVAVFYYYSRFRDRTSLSITLYALLSNIFIILNYYNNSGLYGPTMLIFLMAIFMILAIAPTRQYLFWLLLNMLVVSSLLYYDYSNPDFITITYLDRESRFLDYTLSYIIILLLIFMVTRYIRKAYKEEKLLAEKKALELKEANEKKNKIFSILAHDLSAPLTSIQGYLMVLSEIGLSEDEKDKIHKELLNTTNNTGQILTNLLSWTRAQMNGLSLNLTRLNLLQATAETIHIQQNFAAKKNISLLVEINDSIWLTADANMLQLIIRNLINNAIKFSNPGDRIRISASQKSDRIIIAVEDQGIGIADDLKPALFSLKTDPTRGTKNEKGVGLGLLLCKEFAELQHGEIWFESPPAGGTTFFVSLPAASPVLKNQFQST